MSGAEVSVIRPIAQGTAFHRFGGPGEDGLSHCRCGEAAESAVAEAEHHAEIVVAMLRRLPVEQRMAVMGMVQVTMPGGGGWWLADDNGLVRGGPGAPSLRPVYVEPKP